MGVLNPLTNEQASPQLPDTVKKLAARARKVPNIFAAMALQRRPRKYARPRSVKTGSTLREY